MVDDTLDSKFSPESLETLALPGNGHCVDCEAECIADPWVSVSHGTVICVHCAGRHRSLGVQVSFVRSLILDTLKEKELAAMRLSGNECFLTFLEAPEQQVRRHVWRQLPIEQRYHTPVADLYRRRLRAQLEDETLPTDLRVSVKPPQPLQATKRQHRWTPDSEASQCELCRKRFTLFYRRHHCRSCGRCICDGCSSFENSGDHGGQSDETESVSRKRQCKVCAPPVARSFAQLTS